MKRLPYLIQIVAFFFLLACSNNNTNDIVESGTIAPKPDPEEWIKIPAGEFYKGLHAHKTLIDYDYEIMITDVTTAQYVNYLNYALEEVTIRIENNKVYGYYPGDEFHEHKHELEVPEGDYIHLHLDEPGVHIQYIDDVFSAETGFEDHPVVMVSWFGAKAYCDFFGWRLPTEDEWEKAARGTDTRAYPWGDEIKRNQANYYSSQNLLKKLLGPASRTTPVGYYNGGINNKYQTEAGISPYGLYDMAGNVWQWTGSIYPDQHYRYMRGGSFMNYEYNLRVWARNSAGPDYYSIATGFRCARDIESN